MVVGRLAPSPTGSQHVGNARTFLLAWLSIRSQHGHLVLRIEDIDSPRIKNWAVQQAIDDLNWLGLNWDEGPGQQTGNRKYVQSQRMDLYLAALEKLKKAEAVYPCTCSRSDVANAASAPHELSEAPVYGQTCAHRCVKDADALDGSFSWRFRTNSEGVKFMDGFKGNFHADIAVELGDFVVFKSDNTPSYQLTVAIDDTEMGINEVLRGEDLIQSTFRQIAIYDFFGWEPPSFIHVPLVVGKDGRRLAKRHGDTRLSYFREKGVKPERIIGLLAHSLGWLDQAQEIAAADLIEEFNLATIPDEPFVLGEEELAWLLQ